MTRHASKSEAAAAFQAEMASRWRRLPAGQVFPATFSYLTSDTVNTEAHRVGIAPPVPCATGLDPAVARVLAQHGCLRVLRATYLDASQAVVATAGIAVMPSTAAARAAFGGFDNQTAGVRPVAFAGTVAHLFGDREREQFTAVDAGPYVFFAAVGYTAGLTGGGLTGNQALTDLANAVSAQEMTVLTGGGGQPCRRKDIRC